MRQRIDGGELIKQTKLSTVVAALWSKIWELEDNESMNKRRQAFEIEAYNQAIKEIQALIRVGQSNGATTKDLSRARWLHIEPFLSQLTKDCILSVWREPKKPVESLLCF